MKNKERKREIIILGIDPGLAQTGFGVLLKKNNTLSLVDYGCIPTDAKKNFPNRLHEICLEMKKVIQRHKPQTAAIESLYFYKNISSALKVAQAKGAIISLCVETNIPVQEFTPLQVKQSITGYGKASKEQIQKMVMAILKLKKIPQPSHSADALAVAICCAHTVEYR